MKIFASLLLAVTLCAQAPFDPSTILKPPTDAWPTYSGDYTGRRYSPLKQINSSNVEALSLAWLYRVNSPGQVVKSSPVEIKGVLYLSSPDNVWAVDARSGREIACHAALRCQHAWHRRPGQQGQPRLQPLRQPLSHKPEPSLAIEPIATRTPSQARLNQLNRSEASTES